MSAIEEHISHGDHDAIRYIESDLSPASVLEMLNSCSYLKLPVFSKDAVLTSRTQAQVLADRVADAERVARELVETGVSEIGWVEYRVMDAIMEAAALRSAGWDTDKILRCE